MPQMAFKSITDESWASICLLISQGHHKRAACGAAGISMPTFYRYRQLGLQTRAEWDAREADDERTEPPEAAKRLIQLEAAEARDIIELEKIIKRSVQGAMFLLQRRYSDAYGDPDSGMTADHMETFLRTIEAIKEGALAYHEIANTLGEHLATRLFGSAGVVIAEYNGAQ